VKDDPSLVLFFNLGDEDELEWPNGGGNKGLFSNQPRNENLEGGFLVFGVGMVAGILIDTSSDFLALDDFLAAFFELFAEKPKADFDPEVDIEALSSDPGDVSASEELIAWSPS